MEPRAARLLRVLATPAAAAAVSLALGATLLGVGWMAEFLSKPIVTGFVLGLTVLVILGEVPHLLGVPTPEG